MATTLESPDSQELPRKRWNRDDVRRMLEVGLLDPNKHYELIEGEIIVKVGQGRRHILIINRLFKILGIVFGIDYVQSQGTLPLNFINEPEPDTVVLDRTLDEYVDIEPGPENVRLIVEVSDTTLNSDRQVKGLLYARAGVIEYWIINIQARKLEVHRQPTPDGYALRMVLTDQETVSPLTMQTAEIRVLDLLP
jgi:Uma2 family endonuclease